MVKGIPKMLILLDGANVATPSNKEKGAQNRRRTVCRPSLHSPTQHSLTSQQLTTDDGPFFGRSLHFVVPLLRCFIRGVTKTCNNEHRRREGMRCRDSLPQGYTLQQWQICRCPFPRGSLLRSSWVGSFVYLWHSKGINYEFVSFVGGLVNGLCVAMLCRGLRCGRVRSFYDGQWFLGAFLWLKSASQLSSHCIFI